MGLLTQRGPEEPANQWVFWAIAFVVLAFVVVVVVARLL